MNPRPQPDTGPLLFGHVLKQHWDRLGLHQAEFCRRVGSPAGWVQQIREGKKTPPVERMSVWSDVLELTGRDRQLFLDLAAIQHLPPVARPRFAALALSQFLGTKS